MSGLYILLGGIVLAVTIVGVMDWINDRRERRSHPGRQH